MRVTPHPPHRSVREELPHTAPASGNDDKASEYQSASRTHPSSLYALCPALCPECVLPKLVPFGQPPSLHLLRSLHLVRRFPRYYEAVRLPIAVHHRRASSDFPMRPPTLTGGSHGISRFSNIERLRMLRVSDSAGPVNDWLYNAAARGAFPIRSTRSAP